MCTYIAAVLPAETNRESAAEHFDKHGHGFWVQPTAPQAIRKGDLYVLTYRKHCDCGTILGSGWNPVMPTKDPEAAIPKLRKKGWSETKIERWLADKMRQPNPQGIRQDEELARWMWFLQDSLHSGLAKRIGLFVHFYNRERFDDDLIQNVVHVSLDELSQEVLIGMAGDTVYEFALSPGKRPTLGKSRGG